MTELVLIREPASLALRRVLARAFVPAVAAAAWAFEFTAWATWVVTIAAIPGAFLTVFAVLNIAKNRLHVLVRTADGALRWPSSVQEILLRRPPDEVRGAVISVVKEPPLLLNRTEPRISLFAEGSSLTRVPLFGADVDDAVAGFNEDLAESGIQLVLLEPEAHDDAAALQAEPDPDAAPES